MRLQVHILTNLFGFYLRFVPLFIALFVLAFLLHPAFLTAAQDETTGETDCFERPSFQENPWSDGTLWCLELVIEEPEAGPLGFTALTTAPDGTIFAARPLTGEVFAVWFSADGSYQATPIADGLTLPNGLAYHLGKLYIAGGSNLYVWDNWEVTTLVDDLPSGGGLWTGGVVVGPDERLYVATGAECDRCVPDDPLRGAILSFDLEGGDRQVIATGLRHPADLAFFGATLYVVDSAGDSETGPALDELNAVTGPGQDFGWPYCAGPESTPTELGIEAGATCDGVTPPVHTFPARSNPIGLAAYTSDTFSWIQDSLLVVLGGSNNQAVMEGFYVVAIPIQNGTPVGAPYVLIPNQSPENEEQFTVRHMNYRGSGFWPQRPLDVAVSAEGWVYISAGDGRIYALRPL